MFEGSTAVYLNSDTGTPEPKSVSIVDVVSVLIDQPDYDNARNYWKVLKNRLK